MAERRRPGPRLRIESEFAAGPLAAGLAEGREVSPLPPLGPADYPNFGAGDLLLTRHRGDFIKACPGTLNYNCCGLTIFHFGLGCDLGCRYCILSAYLGTEALVLFGNVEEGLAELEARLAEKARELPDLKPGEAAGPCPDGGPAGSGGAEGAGPAPGAAGSWRYCTGEFTDSLLLDSDSGLAARLIEIFARHRAAVLELKTKTDRVDHLLNLKHQGRTVISFSVNSPPVCAGEEGRAAPLKARLAAAKRAAAAGYPIGLHFDPLIFRPGWEEAYAATLELIGQNLAGAEVAWVSLGCFRYLPALKPVMLARHGDTSLYDAEFISGGDGKMRYPRPLRAAMYKFLLRGLRRVLPPSAVIYLCMESPRIWRDVFGRDPGTEGLTAMLDRRARQLVG